MIVYDRSESRRLKKIRIEADYLLRCMLITKGNITARLVGLPKDLKIRAIDTEDAYVPGGIILIAESQEFEEVPAYEVPPTLDLTIQIMKITTEDCPHCGRVLMREEEVQE